MKNAAMLITGGRVMDPGRGLDEVCDLLLLDGKIASVGARPKTLPEGCAILDAAGLVVCPGFIDLHCHLREPGFEEKETIATGTLAAARGGFTTVCCMPNTEPPLDSAAAIEYVLKKAAAEGAVRVLTTGCITRGRKGKELAEMAELARSGVIGFSDDGDCVADSRLMRHAMEYSTDLGLPIMEHCEDKHLSEGGTMNEGAVAARLGMGGVPAAAEETMVARDISLAQMTGARLHVQHVSTAGSVELVRRAKRDGVKVTAEATPHHLALTEDRVMGADWGYGLRPHPHPTSLPGDAYDTNARVNPPLRTQPDRAALIEGLKDGTIDAIATDHAPHTWVDKTCEFGIAASGISGLETALGVLTTLVHYGELDLVTVVSRLTGGPAKVLGERFNTLGALVPDASADIAVFDPRKEWTVSEAELVSKGKNNPFKGSTLRGRVVATICCGKLVYKGDGLKVKNA